MLAIGALGHMETREGGAADSKDEAFSAEEVGYVFNTRVETLLH